MMADHRTLGRANCARSRRRPLAEILIAMSAMLPRQALPHQFYLITRRCAQRQFLLRSDKATNNAFLYCLIDAAVRCEIDVLLPCAMSNHYRAVIYDRAGRYPEFIEHFHKLLARSQNALRGRWENVWSCEQTCVVRLVDRQAVIDKLVYTATNPVADHRVDRVARWPGVNGLLNIAQSIAVRDVPTPPGASAIESRPRIGLSARVALVDRSGRQSIAIGL